MTRAGRYITQVDGYAAFIPAPLPPAPPLDVDQEILQALSQADQCLGRLDGIARLVPNPDLFVAMYVRQEAVLSSQIEGTQASLTDVLQFEAGMEREERLKDVTEVSNYVRAMNHGLERLATLPLSKRLVREIHEKLLAGTRGSLLTPGEFRTSQNWIGPQGSTLANASFVPPPPSALHDALDAWESFLHDETFPPVIQAALAHAQFETIHPFLDGNGRIGRLLITFLLCTRGVLARPLLYLSAYLKRNRAEYYDRLQAVRDHGHWEPWVKFFLRGVATSARDATDTADKILALQKRLREHADGESGSRFPKFHRATDVLFRRPMVTVAQLAEAIDVSIPTAGKLVDHCVESGFLRERTGRKRNRWFEFGPFLDLFESAEPVAPPTPPERTQGH